MDSHHLVRGRKPAVSLLDRKLASARPGRDRAAVDEDDHRMRSRRRGPAHVDPALTAALDLGHHRDERTRVRGHIADGNRHYGGGHLMPRGIALPSTATAHAGMRRGRRKASQTHRPQSLPTR